ncbi:hypothetical protein [Actinomadura madurae]|uniref:hypothetical protein n=1 Tax=Actinomadura madurae TaxID=1993 RepID=UPI0020D22091|nr:hypothetical protein [Actinomadura madurae]MCQ0014485.1 hypothetical protein [Actinomadura madurae]
MAAASDITEPTDRSMPSVPITSAIPSETIRTGVTWTSWFRKLSTSRKWGVKNALNSSSTATAR